jgi:hypothetical protein
MFVKKIVGFIALLTMTIACKDIEKNPSSCGSEHIESQAGECLSNSFTLDLKIQEADKNLYNRKFIKSFIKENLDRGDIEWNPAAITQSLGEKEVISKYVEFVLTREKLSEIAAVHFEDMEKVYLNGGYTEGAYEANSKANLYNNLLRQSAIRSFRLFDRSIGDYSLDELIELTDKKQELLNDLESYTTQKVLVVTDDRGGVQMTTPDYYSEKGKRILEDTREAIALDENCADREAECIQTLKDDVEGSLNSLYQTLYRNL